MSCDLTSGHVFGFNAPPDLDLGLLSGPDFQLELVVNGEMTVRQLYKRAHFAYYDALVEKAGGSDR